MSGKSQAPKRSRETRPTLRKSSSEHDWICQHPKALRPYVGEYVAIYRNKVVAHGRDGQKVIEDAKKVSPRHLLAYIDASDEELVI